MKERCFRMIPDPTYKSDTDSELPELASWDEELFFDLDEALVDLFDDCVEEPEVKTLTDLKRELHLLQQDKSGQGSVAARIARLNFDEVLSIPNDRRISTLDPVWVDATLP